MESFATPFPVLFDDGETAEPKQMGAIGVHSVLSFKRFQALMSQKINLPASQLTAVFVCRRAGAEGDKRQKLPVNENTNFNIILNQHHPSKERDAHFLISIKKSKKDRKGGVGGKKKTDAEDDDDDDSVEQSASPPDKGGMLRNGLPAPPSALPAATAAAAQREAAQRERERLNVALGRTPSSSDVKSVVAAIESRAVTAAKPPPVAGVPRPAGVPLPATPQGAPPGAVPPAPPRGGLPAPLLPPGGARPPAGKVAPLPQAGGPRAGDAAGADGAARPLCKFCAFCRERGHAPPFHWCCDDRVVPAFRGPAPYGAISPAPRRLGSVGA